jgi:hypothetical protein
MPPETRDSLLRRSTRAEAMLRAADRAGHITEFYANAASAPLVKPSSNSSASSAKA